MTTPTIPNWATETCPGASTETTDIIDAYGPSTDSVWGLSLNLWQRSSTRDNTTLYEPTAVMLCVDKIVTRLTEGELRALAHDALTLADQLAAITYVPSEPSTI